MNAPTNELSDQAMTLLPIFGGATVDREGVWSWDADRLIIGIARPFEIVTRADYAERFGIKRGIRADAQESA